MANDNSLFAALRSALLYGFSVHNLPNILVERDFQPEQQGAPTPSCIFISKIYDTRYGHAGVSYGIDVDDNFVETNTQYMETAIQCTARIDPNSIYDEFPTSGDLINIASQIMQSGVIIAQLKAQEIGVLRIRDIRSPNIVNDYDRNEVVPSFDVIFTHKRSMPWVIESVDIIETGIHRV